MTSQDGLIPPQDLGAEEHVLGAILLNNSVLDHLEGVLEPQDFYLGRNGRIYQAARHLYAASEPVDVVTLVDALDKAGDLEKVGGRMRISELAALAVSASNAGHHARIIREHAVRRRLIKAGQEITRAVYEREGDVDALADQAERLVQQAAGSRGGDDFVTTTEALTRAYQKLTRMHESGRELLGLSTGIPSLDRLTSGFQDGNLIIVAARPSMGKSALAIGFCTHICLREKTPVALFSLEMGIEDVMYRAIAIEANIGLLKVSGKQKASHDEWLGISRSISDLSNLGLYTDTRSSTVAAIRSAARRAKTRHGIGAVVIDYLGLITPAQTYERHDLAIAALTRDLKRLAVDLELPVILLSQLNRKCEERHDKRPMLSDLRDSGAIEQDADIVIFVYRDAVYSKDADQTEAELIVAKNRNGQTGTAEANWDPHRARFHAARERHLHAV